MRYSSAWESLARAPRTVCPSVVRHMGGREARRKEPYLAVRRRESRTATTPRSVTVRSRRPAPWASSSAACEAATRMNPLPPAAATASVRACVSGSFGLGKGIRSMTTSRHVRPGTSTPCHSEIVPNRQAASSAANMRTRVGIWSSPWQ